MTSILYDDQANAMNSSSEELAILTPACQSALKSLIRIIHYRRRQIATFCLFSLTLTAAIHVAIPPQHKAVGLIFFMPNGVASKDTVARLLVQALDSSRKEVMDHLQVSNNFIAQFAASGRNFVSVTVTSSDEYTARMVADYYVKNSGSIVEPMVRDILEAKKSALEQRRASNEKNIESVEHSLYALLGADPALLPSAQQYSAAYLGLAQKARLGAHAAKGAAKEHDVGPPAARTADVDPPRTSRSDLATTMTINPDKELNVRRLTRELAALEYAKFGMLAEVLQEASHSQIYTAPAGNVIFTKNFGYFSSLITKLLFVGFLTIMVGVLVALILHAFTLVRD